MTKSIAAILVAVFLLNGVACNRSDKTRRHPEFLEELYAAKSAKVSEDSSSHRLDDAAKTELLDILADCPEFVPDVPDVPDGRRGYKHVSWFVAFENDDGTTNNMFLMAYSSCSVVAKLVLEKEGSDVGQLYMWNTEKHKDAIRRIFQDR